MCYLNHMKNNQSTYKFFLPKQMNDHFDVAVIGGGLAGVMAAISSAREGKKTILIEKYGFLGGMATAGLVAPFMPYVENGSGKIANAGLFQTMQEEIYELGGSEDPFSRFFHEEFLKVVLDRMVARAGVKLLFHAKMCEVERDGRQIKSVTVATVSGMIKICAKIFVDATGNADLCAFAGLPYEQGRTSDGLGQPMTLCFRFGNVDWSRFDKPSATALYNKMQAEGKIKNPRENILVFRYPVENIMHCNTTRMIGMNPTDVEEVTQSEQILREQMLEMYHFMKENIAGMEDCVLLGSAPESGIRESRRIVGFTQITVDDILGVRKFEDRIARGTYSIDIHNPSGKGTVFQKIRENDYYTIPYRSLLPQDTDNLIVAGRSICATHEAMSSIRIMPITSCMGEAAGIAASMAIDTNAAVQDIHVSGLQEKIVAYGGLI